MNEHSCRYEEGKYCSIQARLAHLCKSEFICRFDEISPVTGQYSFDISEVDKIIDDANSVVANREEINAKIQSANDQARNLKKQLKEAKERADNGWERVRYLERKLKDTESLNEQLLRELARRDESADAVKSVDNLMSLITGWFDTALDNGILACGESETVSDANAYQEDVLKYASDFDTVTEAMKYAAIGLCGEAGEASEIVKKHLYHGYPSDDEHLMRELGDVLWYVAYMAHLLNCPLSLIMALNQDKLAKRYPDGKFDPERSQNRKAGDI